MIWLLRSLWFLACAAAGVLVPVFLVMLHHPEIAPLVTRESLWLLDISGAGLVAIALGFWMLAFLAFIPARRR